MSLPINSQVVKTSIGREILPTTASRAAVRQPDPDAGGASATDADRHETKGTQEDLGQDEEGQLGHHPRRQETRHGAAHRRGQRRHQRQQRKLGLSAPRGIPGQRGIPLRRLDGPQQLGSQLHPSSVPRYAIACGSKRENSIALSNNM